MLEAPLIAIIQYTARVLGDSRRSVFRHRVSRRTRENRRAADRGTRKRRDFDEIIDGAVYGMAVALGFSLLENIVYVFGSDDALRVALLRGFTAVPLHALCGGIMGLSLGYLRIESRGSVAGALLAAVLIHGVYDLILMDSRIAGWLIIPLLVVGWAALVTGRTKSRTDRPNEGAKPVSDSDKGVSRNLIPAGIVRKPFSRIQSTPI